MPPLMMTIPILTHVATPKGTVMTRTGRTRTLKIARETEGVRSVVNKLTIGPKRKA